MAPVIVFTSPDCTSCHAATAYLSRRGVEFEERNIGDDPAAAAEHARLGYAATPIIVVDEAVIVGFNRNRLDSALAASNRLPAERK